MKPVTEKCKQVLLGGLMLRLYVCVCVRVSVCERGRTNNKINWKLLKTIGLLFLINSVKINIFPERLTPISTARQIRTSWKSFLLQEWKHMLNAKLTSTVPTKFSLYTGNIRHIINHCYRISRVFFREDVCRRISYSFILILFFDYKTTL